MSSIDTPVMLQELHLRGVRLRLGNVASSER